MAILEVQKLGDNYLQNGGTQQGKTKTEVDFTFLPTFFVELSLKSLDEVSLVRGGEEVIFYIDIDIS